MSTLPSTQVTKRSRPWGLALVGVLWATAAVGGTLYVQKYKRTPGDPGTPATHWPQGTVLAASGAKHNLVMLIHPKCACSRASLSELSRLLTSLPGRLNAKVVVVKPPGVPADFAQSSSVEQARSLPSTEVIIDEGGLESARFGGATSGHTLLYSPSGELLFSGGITPQRDHQGDSIGRQSIIDLVLGSATEKTDKTSNVYGCELSDPTPARPLPPSK